jgi:hypothetical protein
MHRERYELSAEVAGLAQAEGGAAARSVARAAAAPGDSGGGTCGLLGLEIFLLLAWRRRRAAPRP